MCEKKNLYQNMVKAIEKTVLNNHFTSMCLSTSKGYIQQIWHLYLQNRGNIVKPTFIILVKLDCTHGYSASCNFVKKFESANHWALSKKAAHETTENCAMYCLRWKRKFADKSVKQVAT